MFSNSLALKLEYAMSVYQKFRDCKTAGPFLFPCMVFARAWPVISTMATGSIKSKNDTVRMMSTK